MSFGQLSELPEGWAWAKLGELGVWAGGGTPTTSKAEYWEGGTIPWVSAKDMKSEYLGTSKQLITEAGRAAARLTILPPGTVLLVVRGMILARDFPVAVTTAAATINQDLRALIPSTVIDPNFLLRALQFISSEVVQATGEATHGTRRLESDKLKSWPIPIPPLAEQRRIVAAVERILESVSSARERLERVPTTLKRFRQSVLAAACSGRLTSESFDNDFPQNWRSARLGELLHRIEAGKSFQCSPKPATDSEWGVIKVSAMTWGEFDPAENKAVLPGTTVDARNEVHPGDLLLSRSNTVELAGATVLVRRTRPRLLLSDKSLRLVSKDGVSSEWLWRALQAPSTRAQMAEMATGTSNSMRNISQEKLATIELQVPPLREQEEIARRVSALFGLADSIEKRSESALQRVQLLTQAVLAKAFRGELVPTEAELARREGRSYEPASELLARLKASGNGEAPRARARTTPKRAAGTRRKTR